MLIRMAGFVENHKEGDKGLLFGVPISKVNQFKAVCLKRRKAKMEPLSYTLPEIELLGTWAETQPQHKLVSMKWDPGTNNVRFQKTNIVGGGEEVANLKLQNASGRVFPPSRGVPGENRKPHLQLYLQDCNDWETSKKVLATFQTEEDCSHCFETITHHTAECNREIKDDEVSSGTDSSMSSSSGSEYSMPLDNPPPGP